MTVKGLIGGAAPDNVFGSGEVVHLAEGECLDPNRVYVVCQSSNLCNLSRPIGLPIWHVDLMLSCPVLGIRCTKTTNIGSDKHP